MNRFKKAACALCATVFLVTLLLPFTLSRASAQFDSQLQRVRELNVQVPQLLSEYQRADNVFEQEGIRERVAATLHKRFVALQELARQSPAEALELALPEDVLNDLRNSFPAAADQLEAHGEWQGSIEVIVENNEQPSVAITHYWLESSDGPLELHFITPGPELQSDDEVAVAGVKFGEVVAVSSAPVKLAAAASFVRGRILVQFRPGVSASTALGLITALGAKKASEIPHIGVHIVALPANASEEAFVQAFKARPEVAFAEVDHVVAPAGVTPNDPSYPSEWHLPKIAGPTAWSSTTGSSSVTIAILDTGCDPTHPDLASKYVPGWNTYDNNADTHDVYGHGTAVAGSAAALSNNGTGVASVAWDCQIMPVRISDTGGYGYGSTIAAGLTWAADHGARVANISFRMDYSSTVTSAAQYFQSKGGVVTMSAGNAGSVYTTGDNPYILVISATDSSDVLASWSNNGNNLDLAAPGVSIMTTNNGGGYGSWSGTSFSAPIVAGVAGLVISANPSLSADQVQDVLKQSADDLGTGGYDTKFGWGRVNAARAVSLAFGGSTPADTTPPNVSITSPAAASTISGTVTVQASASDNVGVASLTLYLDGATVASTTNAALSWSWNTLTAANGTHTLQAVATDTSGNSATSQINVTVNNVTDTTAPIINITSPANGATVTRNISVTVNATDNVGVVKVELYVDGSLTATSTSAPFTTSWNTRKAASGAHTLQCKAYDAAGNVGVSPTVTVNK